MRVCTMGEQKKLCYNKNSGAVAHLARDYAGAVWGAGVWVCGGELSGIYVANNTR